MELPGLQQWAVQLAQRREQLQRAAFREQPVHREASRRAHPACPRHDDHLRGLPAHRGGQMALRRLAAGWTERELRQAV